MRTYVISGIGRAKKAAGCPSNGGSRGWIGAEGTHSGLQSNIGLFFLVRHQALHVV